MLASLKIVLNFLRFRPALNLNWVFGEFETRLKFIKFGHGFTKLGITCIIVSSKFLLISFTSSLSYGFLSIIIAVNSVCVFEYNLYFKNYIWFLLKATFFTYNLNMLGLGGYCRDALGLFNLNSIAFIW